MSNASSIVLITSAISPPEGVFGLEMKSPIKRRLTTKAAIFFWASLGVRKIVIADATGQEVLDHSELLMVNQLNVEVEQISYFQNNELVLRSGKGFGEGALIEYALEKSRLLSTEEGFFKCTGKVYCRNFADIFNMIQHNGIKNIFWKDVLTDASMDTRFYYTSKLFFKKYLIPAYQNVDDKNFIYAEHCILKMAQKELPQGRSIRPLLTGFSGSMDQPYFDLSLGFLDNSLPCWAN